MQRNAVEDRRSALLPAALRVIARDGSGRASTRVVAVRGLVDHDEVQDAPP